MWSILARMRRLTLAVLLLLTGCSSGGADNAVGFTDGRIFLNGDPAAGESFAEILERHGLDGVEATGKAAPGDENKIMHAQLETDGGFTLMASDTMPMRACASRIPALQPRAVPIAPSTIASTIMSRNSRRSSLPRRRSWNDSCSPVESSRVKRLRKAHRPSPGARD